MFAASAALTSFSRPALELLVAGRRLHKNPTAWWRADRLGARRHAIAVTAVYHGLRGRQDGQGYFTFAELVELVGHHPAEQALSTVRGQHCYGRYARDRRPKGRLPGAGRQGQLYGGAAAVATSWPASYTPIAHSGSKSSAGGGFGFLIAGDVAEGQLRHASKVQCL